MQRMAEIRTVQLTSNHQPVSAKSTTSIIARAVRDVAAIRPRHRLLHSNAGRTLMISMRQLTIVLHYHRRSKRSLRLDERSAVLAAADWPRSRTSVFGRHNETCQRL